MRSQCLHRVREKSVCSNSVLVYVIKLLYICICFWVFLQVFFCVCHCFLDPQPVHDVCGLSSHPGIHCWQDSACSGQDLWLLRTRCASDEYFKYCSLKSYRAGKLSSSPWFMKRLLSLRKLDFFQVYDLVMVSVILVLCVWMCECAGVGLPFSCSLWGHAVLQC